VTENLIDLAQIIGPAVAVYAAIRADMAAMHVRVEHLERDLLKMEQKNEQKTHAAAPR
jgi:hypothetical protein